MPGALLLRPVRPGDLPHFFDHARDETALRMVLPEQATGDWAAFSAKWDRILADAATTCRTIEVDGATAGYVSQFELLGDPSIAYWLGRAFWGRGVARQAVAMFLAEVRKRPLFARVQRDNLASRRVLEANGFHQIGTDRYVSAPFERDVSELLMRLDG